MSSPAENPWKDLREQAGTYILKEDEATVRSFNASLLGSDPREIELHVLPEPFLGFHDAPVVVLLANPGSVDEDRYIDRSWITGANWEAITTPGGTPMYSLDDRAASMPGGIWWRGATRGLLAPGRGYADLAEKILVVQYHGYHSRKPCFPRQALPSQRFAFALVADAMKRKAAIIIASASRQWLSAVLGLDGYRWKATKNSPQSRSLSPRNLGSGYAMVSAALDRPRAVG